MNPTSNELFSNINESTVAAHGVVATTQPLAATIGLEILKQGGNAIDGKRNIRSCGCQNDVS
jgi:gamma-glutamyltranspeptidase